MQRTFRWLAVAALLTLAGCAGRDPNLAVKGMNEFGRAPGDYTLRVNLYDLDAEGKPRLASQDDASLGGFVSRTLAARGYVLKPAGPARYDVQVHLLCGNMRTADMGLMSEELPVPSQAVGPGYSSAVYYWLPDTNQSSSGREFEDRHDAMQRTRLAGGSSRPDSALSSIAPGRVAQEYCQGRVLVAVSPASAGPAREVFVTRAATEDCRSASGCAADVCRTALEHSLVELLEHRF